MGVHQPRFQLHNAFALSAVFLTRFSNAENGLRYRTNDQNNNIIPNNRIRPLNSTSSSSTVQLFADGDSYIEGKKGELDLSHLDIENMLALSTIEVQIFSDSSVLVFEKKFAKEESWYGEATSDAGSGSMNLLISDGEVTGSLNAGGTVFSIATQADGTVSVLGIDGQNYPPEVEPLGNDELDDEPGYELLDRSGLLSDDNVIDIMCIYTLRAMCGEAGQAYPCADTESNHRRIKNRCESAVQETNTAFALSGIRRELRLVHTGPIQNDYDEFRDAGKLCDVLDHVTNDYDGHMEYVHDMRDQYGADLVSLVTERQDSCGCGWLFSGSPRNGMSVVSRICMTGYFSFAHEVGHNFGCHHNQDSSKSKHYPYGYRDPSKRFRSIMSYNCESGCDRLQRFSNDYADVEYKRNKYAPIGASNMDCARQIEEIAPYVANFRDSVAISPSITPAPSPAPTPRPTVSRPVRPDASGAGEKCRKRRRRGRCK